MKEAYVEAVEVYSMLYKIGLDTVNNYDKDTQLISLED
jgi:hypothetical protein